MRGALAAAILLAACGKRPEPPDSFDRRAMLVDTAERVIVPAYVDFVSAAESLAQSTAKLPGTASDVENARAAWKRAMVVWQRAEAFQLGPAGGSTQFRGGLELRDHLYSWPKVNTCRVDQLVVSQEYRNEGFFETAQVNAFGLAALEYALFVDGPGNSCPSQATINTDGSWAALSAADKASRRAEYAHRAAQHLVKKAKELLGAWERSGGNFLAQLQTAGEPGSVYPSAQAAVNDLFTALFYVDFKVKDMKLGAPAGIHPSCNAPTCPELLESPFARHSAENIAANLSGFEAVFLGGDGLGFDDLLADRGAKEVADAMVADARASRLALESLGGLEAALSSEPDKVRAVHAQVKQLTDRMKSQMVSVLNLSVPKEGAADND